MVREIIEVARKLMARKLELAKITGARKSRRIKNHLILESSQGIAAWKHDELFDEEIKLEIRA